MIVKILWYGGFAHRLKSSIMLYQYLFKALVGDGTDKEAQNLVFSNIKDFQTQSRHQGLKGLKVICHVVECLAQRILVTKRHSSDGSSCRQWIYLSQRGERT